MKKAKHLRKNQDIKEIFYSMIFGLAWAIFFIAGF